MRATVLLPSLGTGAECFGEQFPAGMLSIATVSGLPGLRMMYGAGGCNLGFAAVPGEMGGKKEGWEQSEKAAGTRLALSTLLPA